MKLKMSLRYKSTIPDPVPLINIVAIIILFFTLAVNFVGGKGIVVDLPRIEQPELYKLDSVVIILLDKKIFLFENEIGIDKLKEELIKKSPQLLAIKAGKDVPYSSIADVIALAQSIGIKQIVMATDNGKLK